MGCAISSPLQLENLATHLHLSAGLDMSQAVHAYLSKGHPPEVSLRVLINADSPGAGHAIKIYGD